MFGVKRVCSTLLRRTSRGLGPVRFVETAVPAKTRNLIREAPDEGNKTVTVQVLGPRKLDLINEVTNLIYEMKGNINESRMGEYGNDFGIQVGVTIPAKLSLTEVREKVVDTLSDDYIVTARASGKASPLQQSTQIMMMTVDGPDQPMIVLSVCELLKDHQVTIKVLETDTTKAPFAGYSVFQAKIVLAFPYDIDEDKFAQDIAALESEMAINIDLQHTHEDSESESESEGEESETERLAVEDGATPQLEGEEQAKDMFVDAESTGSRK